MPSLGCQEADQYLQQINSARERVNKVAVLKRAIDAADAGIGSEAAVVAAAVPLGSYDHPFISRVKLGTRSVELLSALQAAVDEKSPSDRRIAAAVDALRAGNLDLLARLDESSRRWRPRPRPPAAAARPSTSSPRSRRSTRNPTSRITAG